MSSFKCPICGKNNIDAPGGYIEECDCVSNHSPEVKEIKLNCDCVGGKLCGYMEVRDFKNGDVNFDIYRYTKKKDVCIGGVVLNKKDVKKLIKFLTNLI